MIEPEYLQPVLMSPSDINRCVTQARREAFCCSDSLNSLAQKGHHGAIAWIRRFENARNNKNKLLPEVLARAGMRWYEMNADNKAHLVMSLAYGDRLFVGRLDPPAFINQRLMMLNSEGNVDIPFAHALLNSTIGLVMIEAIGFGRGLGALDLNKNRIEARLHILNPEILNDQQKERILNLFHPIATREILEISDELEQLDRIRFDDAILEAYEIDVAREVIYDALRTLIEIRRAALS